MNISKIIEPVYHISYSLKAAPGHDQYATPEGYFHGMSMVVEAKSRDEAVKALEAFHAKVLGDGEVVAPDVEELGMCIKAVEVAAQI